MRILVHDYAGHPFQVQLSRALAARGHQVRHCFSGSNLTPQGALARSEDDPPGFEVAPIVLPEQIAKGNLLKRRRQEIQHGRKLLDQVREYRPDVVISANSPLDVQTRLQAECARRGIAHVYWLQDLIGLATHTILKDKIPVVGALAGRYYMRVERKLLQSSDAVVAISEDFGGILRDMGVPDASIHVVQNWAPLPDMPVVAKRNDWSVAQGVDETFNFVYSGTLGMKHNPRLLLAVAEAFADRPNVNMIVISEGPGREWLERNGSGAKNLRLLDFQPFSAVPSVLGSADVVVAILDPGAGVISVPSKVSSYMCAQRPMLLGVPAANLAARIVRDHGMGLLADPADEAAFVAAARALHADTELRATAGRSAREYAEREFDIDTIADRFEAIAAREVTRRNGWVQGGPNDVTESGSGGRSVHAA